MMPNDINKLEKFLATFFDDEIENPNTSLVIDGEVNPFHEVAMRAISFLVQKRAEVLLFCEWNKEWLLTFTRISVLITTDNDGDVLVLIEKEV